MKIFILFILGLWGLHASAASWVLVGEVPNIYLKRDHNGKSFRADDDQSTLAYLLIENSWIAEIRAIDLKDYRSLRDHWQKKKYNVLELTNSNGFAMIYPGLIDLHGHNKQNMLPTWTSAKGRFANRYEWRLDSQEYKKVMSQNMNPWSQHPIAEAAAYRWSEMQAMVLGTTYLQGYKLYDKDFLIHSVEDPEAFISARDRVRSAGDIVDPYRWSFLWNQLRPLMEDRQCVESEQCYLKALQYFLEENCQITEASADEILRETQQQTVQLRLPRSVVEDLAHEVSLGWLQAARDQMQQICPSVVDFKEMTQFLNSRSGNYPHFEIVSRHQYLKQANASAIITHLGEGRPRDPITWLEFKLLRLVGLAQEGLNIIHGNGLEAEDFVYMAKNNMGLIWSPYSNFLLYGESVDIAEALNAGVNIAVGSDWTPTGSKAVLEEIKLAAQYLDDIGITVPDRTLYKMMTENPARMIRHFGYENSQERGIGTLEEGAMASILVVEKNHTNPFTNLVRVAGAQQVQLVVVDGEALYGDEPWMQKIWGDKDREILTDTVFSQNPQEDPELFPQTFGRTELDAMMEEVGRAASQLILTPQSSCYFKNPKSVRIKRSFDFPTLLTDFLTQTGLDLDRPLDIYRFLGVALLSQSQNTDFDGSTLRTTDWAITSMPPLYSCQDQTYLDSLTSWTNVPLTHLKELANNRESLREEASLFTHVESTLEDPLRFEVHYSIPHELGVLYGLLPAIEPPSSYNLKPVIEVEVDEDLLKTY